MSCTKYASTSLFKSVSWNGVAKPTQAAASRAFSSVRAVRNGRANSGRGVAGASSTRALCMNAPTPLGSCRSLATEVSRSPAFAKLSGEDIDALAQCLSSPETSLLTTIKPASSSTNVSQVAPDELDGYNNDWMDKYHGKSQCVIKPKSTKEVSKVMKYCYSKNIAVVPQGGNTGLVGGGVPVFDEVIINLSKLNQVRSFDATAGTLVCDAGCLLESLDNYVAEKGYMMPLDLGAKGSCHIGGNVATNAGGLRFLRYGSLHGNVLGLEVVLPDGTVLDGLSTLRKDNTGFDLKQLFIGSEGTIGLITGVSIITPRRPEAQNVAVFGLSSFEDIQNTFVKTRQHCGEILSAFEFMDQDAFDLVQKHATRGVKDPFSDRYPFYVLIETSGSKKDHDDEKLTGLLEELMESETIVDGVLAQDESQAQGLWALRESIPEAAGKLGSVFKYDLSMPIAKMNELVVEMRNRFEQQGVMGNGIKTVVGYGHIGDGNLHINIVADSYDPKLESVIEPYIYEWTSNVNGSISAEHGLGLMKATKIGYSKSATSIEYMKKIKEVFDPKGILSPYKYIQV
ncbi:putative DLD2-D-lactate dehydrogenase [Tilletiaria anomala UBC 951]|uniref:Putative DLD2-D-lactate dehydrogenase n=1 Tax=Tilletiaria anomala (strain ATCC 24038 / CBS 436.72 / UBC 951) TaxID=1037660 RepID=A0A066VA63_TILAU|nr:putative DLD2-D-lactate dehydrogenase [Tilletiaria anomala UBC 951]KDN38642.1 putative DLD2-D-lactate dehydrogenase [Tilletiaria anomala UBC 951]